MNNPGRRLRMMLLILLALLVPAIAGVSLQIRTLGPGTIIATLPDSDAPFLAWQVEGGTQAQAERTFGTMDTLLVETLIPGKRYTFATGTDEEDAIKRLNATGSVAMTMPRSSGPFKMRGFQAVSFLPFLVSPGADPYALSPEIISGAPPALDAAALTDDLYMMLSYTMNAGDEDTTNPVVWVLESPLGDVACQTDLLTFTAEENTLEDGYLALPYAGLFTQIEQVHGTMPQGVYSASLYWNGMLAAAQDIALIGEDSAPSPSDVSNFTAELLGPGSLLLNWEGERGPYVALYEKVEDPYFSYEEVEGNSLLLDWLIPGRTYRLSVGSSVQEVRSFIYSDASRYIDITLPAEKPYLHRGFQATEVEVYRSNDGDDWYSSKDTYVISEGTAAELKDISKDNVHYYLVVTYGFEESIRTQPDATGLWVMQAPDGSEYFDNNSMFLENYDVRNARYAINIDHVINQYLSLNEAESGTYTFTLYLDGYVAARTSYELP